MSLRERFVTSVGSVGLGFVIAFVVLVICAVLLVIGKPLSNTQVLWLFILLALARLL